MRWKKEGYLKSEGQREGVTPGVGSMTQRGGEVADDSLT